VARVSPPDAPRMGVVQVVPINRQPIRIVSTTSTFSGLYYPFFRSGRSKELSENGEI
jgi:hypothetical protein